MQKMLCRKALYVMIGSVLLVAGLQMGVEMATGQTPAPPQATTQKTLMHVFAYTPVEGATQQDFDAFKQATADMVGKIPGLRRVWVGKLRRPLQQGDRQRLYGVAMEFDDAAALDVYADHPAHTEWIKVYDRVRVPGTTTLDILGE
ncbi:MAG: hypothetical protein A3H27_10560 [Acidobacteria bacterium RIFCSPLOWO2_02_FULL_59_13]|nr:MAG: hypothetical protein A3H27_10560 [Acidobacteria bacterium RIFCSPLOWO2_02_FULL_59_13]